MVGECIQVLGKNMETYGWGVYLGPGENMETYEWGVYLGPR